MSKQDKKIDGTSYNVEYWKHWGEKEFIEQNMKEGVFPELKTDVEKVARLKEHYNMINPKPEATVTQPAKPKKEGE